MNKFNQEQHKQTYWLKTNSALRKKERVGHNLCEKNTHSYAQRKINIFESAIKNAKII